MKENISNYRNLLTVFSILRKYGLIGNKEITGWADAILASESASDYAFIEISTTANTHELVKILEKHTSDEIWKSFSGPF